MEYQWSIRATKPYIDREQAPFRSVEEAEKYFEGAQKATLLKHQVYRFDKKTSGPKPFEVKFEITQEPTPVSKLGSFSIHLCKVNGDFYLFKTPQYSGTISNWMKFITENVIHPMNRLKQIIEKAFPCTGTLQIGVLDYLFMGEYFVGTEHMFGVLQKPIFSAKWSKVIQTSFPLTPSLRWFPWPMVFDALVSSLS